MAFLTYIFEMTGDHDITIVPPDKRKIIASQMNLRFFDASGETQVSLWEVKIDPKTVCLSALVGTFQNSLEGYAEFIDRSTIWVQFVAQELDDFSIDVAELIDSEHEIKVLGTGIVTFKFEVSAGLVLEGTYDPDIEIFTFNRPFTIELNWSEFLLWHVFLIELFNIARGNGAPINP